MSSPSNPSLIGDCLQQHAITQPHAPAFTFLGDAVRMSGRMTPEEQGSVTLSYGALYARARGVADVLIGHGLRGERVLLCHPPGADFVIAFCACLLAGVVAVPLPPPGNRRAAARVRTVAADCQASAILIATVGDSGVDGLLEEGVVVHVIATAGIAPYEAGQSASHPSHGSAPEGDDLALLQYTSGSTGDPKGVAITQANLRANSDLIRAAFGTTSADVGVSWLPLHHDMGLIGSVVHMLHQGVHCVHMTPQAMIRQPLRWLQAVAAFRGTMSGGPDFAWRLVADRIAPEDLVGLDLSRWRVAYSGAEPVRAETMARVAERLAPTSFRAQAFLPCYGMAEATLLISGGPPGPITTGRARHRRDGPSSVACGAPRPAEAVAIVDPDTCSPVDVGDQGEIWVRGPHICRGYWGHDPSTSACFGRLADGTGPWLRTGDLGFLTDGRLHVSGRIKDVLIIHGRKHHPEDIETTVLRISGESVGMCAAFQVATGDRLVVAVEIDNRSGTADFHTQQVKRISREVWAEHELVVDEVVITRVGRLPRTTSGKIQRGEARSLHGEGRLCGVTTV